MNGFRTIIAGMLLLAGGATMASVSPAASATEAASSARGESIPATPAPAGADARSTALQPSFLPDAVLTEGFDDITTLTPTGWSMQNLSQPQGTTSWFQGNDVLAAHSGDPNSYVAANFNNAGDTGTISNWLITPVLPISNGAELVFYTRTTTQPFADRLEVRVSLSGQSTNVGATVDSVGDFDYLQHSINPDLEQDGYPHEDWERQVIVFQDLPEAAAGRIALRYHVTNSGPLGANGNYIGIDTLSYRPPPSVITISPGEASSIDVGAGASGVRLIDFSVEVEGAFDVTITSLHFAAANLAFSREPAGEAGLDAILNAVQLIVGGTPRTATATLSQTGMIVSPSPALVLPAGETTVLRLTAETSPVLGNGAAVLTVFAAVAAGAGIRFRRARMAALLLALALILAACSAPGPGSPDPLTVSFTTQLTEVDSNAVEVEGPLPVSGANVTIRY